MSDHARGLLITVLGVLLVVPDSLFVRLIEAEPLVVSFWRGLTSGGFILLAVLLTQRLGSFRAVAGTGFPGAIYIVLIGSTTICFVLAIHNTSVANVVFIFATIPVFAAIFSRIFLKELIRKRMVYTMGAVAIGLAIIAYGSGHSEVAHVWFALWLGRGGASERTLVARDRSRRISGLGAFGAGKRGFSVV